MIVNNLHDPDPSDGFGIESAVGKSRQRRVVRL
jgi:hypothetical protein